MEVNSDKSVEARLNNQVKMMRMLNIISTRFINLESDRVDEYISECLAKIREMAQSDRATIYLLTRDGKQIERAFESCGENIQSISDHFEGLNIEKLDWWNRNFKDKPSIQVNRVEDWDDDSKGGKDTLMKFGIKSVISLPIFFRETLVCVMTLDTQYQERVWNEDEISTIRMFGDIVANALNRKTAEQVLTWSEETARALLNATSDIAMLVSAEGKVLVINENTAKSFGRPAREIIGKSVYDFFEPTVAKARKEVAKRVIITGQHELMEESRGDHRFDSDVYPIFDANGNVVRLAIFVHDVTSHRATEEHLRNALQKSREAEQLKGQFIANMSHEIRTPLNAIIGLSSLLIMKEEHSKEDRTRYLEIIMSSGESLLAMMNHILDLSKSDSGRFKPRIIQFDLEALLKDLANRYFSQAQAKGLEFNMQTRGRLPEIVVSDPIMVEQVLNNLFANALKFTSAGRINILVDKEKIRLNKINLQFSISDTGMGIPDNQYKRIFKPFYQIDGSSTREYQGAGLGLSITKKYVQLLGGKIWVESEEGQGSTFYFTCEMDLINEPQKLLEFSTPDMQ